MTIRQALIAVLYVMGTAVMVLIYWMTTDHSPRVTVDWFLLHQFGVVIPAIWSYRAHQTLRRANMPQTFEWKLVAWGPAAMAGLVTFHAVRMLEP